MGSASSILNSKNNSDNNSNNNSNNYSILNSKNNSDNNLNNNSNNNSILNSNNNSILNSNNNSILNSENNSNNNSNYKFKKISLPNSCHNLNRDIQILLIDDSSCILKMVSMMINKIHGYNSSSELSGESGIENIKYKWLQKNEQYDIIIVDLFMPDMNGNQVVEKIREMEKTYKMKKHIIVCFTSMYDDQISNEFNYFLKKPFQINDLLIIINKNFV